MGRSNLKKKKKKGMELEFQKKCYYRPPWNVTIGQTLKKKKKYIYIYILRGTWVNGAWVPLKTPL